LLEHEFSRKPVTADLPLFAQKAAFCGRPTRQTGAKRRATNGPAGGVVAPTPARYIEGGGGAKRFYVRLGEPNPPCRI